MTELAVGDRAPDFELPIRAREMVSLASLREKGPVVLLTYVFDFTGG